MDNLTHSLVGAALAHGALHMRSAMQKRQAQTKEKQQEAVTKWIQGEEQAAPVSMVAPFFLISIFANNFPDLDILVTTFTEARLGYLLHHRGHTHTLLFVPLQVLLLVLGVWLVGRWRNKSWNANEWSWMIGLAFVGGFVHIGMDSWNLYGVHPFWPLDNRWYYGDTIFIVEPLIWMTLIPWMWSESTTRWVRNLLLVAYVLGFVALTALYFRTWWYPLFVCFVALGYAWLVRFRLSSVQRTVVGFSVLAVLVGGFFANSLSTRGMLQRSLASSFPSEKVKDIALSSFPGNPFCFEFFSAGEEPKTKRYVVRHGVVSRWPGMVKCPVLTLSRTAPMQREAKRLTLSTGKVVGPFEVYRQSLDGLQRMAQQNCRVRAVLQFIRIPYWKQEKQQMMIGDFRFDRRPGDDFSDFRFPNVPRSCPSLLPPWVPPVKAHGFSVQLRSR